MFALLPLHTVYHLQPEKWFGPLKLHKQVEVSRAFLQALTQAIGIMTDEKHDENPGTCGVRRMN